ncbi:MAG: NAD(P)H-dependent oxidoreductase subunit E [Candidatus Limnocylindrales bacterium]
MSFLPDFLPGVGILRGLSTTLARAFQRKVTVQYPEVVQPISPRHRGRLQLLYDEHGTLKCETCFQCAQACPIECIDMGGVDTKDRFHVHWGPAEQYGERREESALRRSGRPVPDRTFRPFATIDTAPLEEILAAEDYDPQRMLPILEQTQAAYGFLPVAALKYISHATGAWYAEIYGTASFYGHLRLEPPSGHVFAVCRCPACTFRGSGRVVAALETALATRMGAPSPEGAVRLEPGDCHGAAPGTVFVVLDGEFVADVDPQALARQATILRSAHGPEGRA